MKKENCQSVNIGKYDLFPQQMLGKGATGIVYRGQETSTKKPVALKHIDLATIRDDATKSLLQNQIKALKMLSHPNILTFFDIVETTGNLYIVTELLDGGTLKEYLSKKGPLSQVEAMNLFKSILSGCTSVIEGGVIHRDLKPGNIMLHNNSPKIIDFGFCEVIIGGGIVRAFNVGSPAYMAPQALLKTLYSQKSDSWSLGIILFQMLSGQTPDKGMDTKQFLQKVRMNPALIKQSISPSTNKNIRQILQKSLTYKHEDRMSINGMKYLADVFMLNHNKASTVNKNSVSTLNQNSSSTLNPNSVSTLSQNRTSTLSTLNQNRMSTLNHSSEMTKSIQNHLSPINITSPNIPIRESFKKSEADKIKNKFTSSIMYTQLPGKKMKENNQKMNPSSSQYLSTPSPSHPNHPNHPNNPNIRMQPFSYSKGSQPTDGFISFSQFVRPPSMLSTDKPRYTQGNKISQKASSITKESNQTPPVSMKDLLVDKLNWQNASSSSKQIMQRPPGKPVFRQVTVRYI